MLNPDGTHSTTPDQLASTLSNYFKSIFTSNNQVPRQLTGSQRINHQVNSTPPLTSPAAGDFRPTQDGTADAASGIGDIPATDTYTNSTPDMQEL